jgi:predicted DsbA family dithiol-disulfide isomerase
LKNRPRREIVSDAIEGTAKVEPAVPAGYSRPASSARRDGGLHQGRRRAPSPVDVRRPFSEISSAMADVTLTYYLEILSSWCHWAEPAWNDLKVRHAGRVQFEWKIALMNPGDFPVSRAQCDWFYRRSGTIMRSPYMLNSGWLEPERHGEYHAPNLVAEAGRDFGFSDDRLRLALTHAGAREGRKIGEMTEAVAVAAAATGLNAAKLRAQAESREVRARVDASTAEFHAHQINQRPAFVLTDVIGDKAVFSGLVRAEPVAAAIEAMLADSAAYAAHAAHFGQPPAA